MSAVVQQFSVMAVSSFIPSESWATRKYYSLNIPFRGALLKQAEERRRIRQTDVARSYTWPFGRVGVTPKSETFEKDTVCS